MKASARNDRMSETPDCRSDGLTELDDAVDRVLRAAAILPGEAIALDTAAGRTLSASITARIDRPIHPLSAMDGYAICGAKPPLAGQRFALVGAAYPGSPCDRRIVSGEAVRVTTGAPLPAGADRVVVDELVEASAEAIAIAVQPGLKPHVRPAGSDFHAGDELVPKGARLTIAALMAAAACEAQTVTVIRRPRIAIITTGDELVAPGQPLGPNQIPDSISLPLSTMIESWGGVVSRIERSGDVPETVASTLSAMLAAADVLVVVGGASGSERDQSRAACRSIGAQILFEGIAVKPGRPAWAAVHGGKLIVGLPGNPVAALVAARLILAPLTAKMACGSAATAWDWKSGPALEAIGAGVDRDVILTAAWTPRGLKVLSKQQSSSHRQLADLSALVRRRPNCPPSQAGDQVQYLSL